MNLSSRPFVSKVPATSAVRPIRSENGIAKTRAAVILRPGGFDNRLPETRRRHFPSIRQQGAWLRNFGSCRNRTGASRLPAFDPIHLGQQRLDILAGGAFRRRQVVFFLAANAEQSLLQLAVGGERARFHDAVDAAIDHDGDVIGDAGRDADILLDE